MLTSTVEDYLKQLYLEQQHAADQLVAMGRLAAAMGVVPGTATTMVKSLADSGLVSYEPRGGVRLTRGGEQVALRVLRRHRLLELLLVKVLKLDWSEVHAEAERLEHAVSDKVLERIDAILGHPSTDPHGDPIPPNRGRPTAQRLRSLLECEPGTTVRVARIADQAASFLQFLRRHGLTPGAAVKVEARDLEADAIRVRTSADATTLGSSAAQKILVEDLKR